MNSQLKATKGGKKATKSEKHQKQPTQNMN